MTVLDCAFAVLWLVGSAWLLWPLVASIVLGWPVWLLTLLIVALWERDR